MFTVCCTQSPLILPSHAARIPRLLLLHLEGGVYHFFLQLYAMFPCNFVNYLKARYGPKGEAAIFKKHIAVSSTCVHHMDANGHPWQQEGGVGRALYSKGKGECM